MRAARPVLVAPCADFLALRTVFLAVLETLDTAPAADDTALFAVLAACDAAPLTLRSAADAGGTG